MPQKSVGDKVERGFKQVKNGLKDVGERVGAAKSRVTGEPSGRQRARAYRLPAAKETDDRTSTRRRGGSSGVTKEQLYADAKRLGVKGRATMTKAQLARAVGKR